MAEQLNELVALAQLPTVTIRVTTFEAGQHEARRMDTFVVMRHPWGAPRVWTEGYAGGEFVTDRDEVNYYVAAFDQAAGLALSSKESVAFIRDLASQWEARR